MKSPRIHFVLMLVLGMTTMMSYIIWYTEVSKKSASVVSLESQISAAADAMNRIASSKAMFAEIAGDEAKLKDHFVSESGVVAFINDLESLGIPNHATVNVLSVSKGGSVQRPTLILSVTIEGTFDAVLSTIGAIEYAPYTISISTLSVVKDAKNSWRATVSLSVGAVTETKTATPQP